MKIVVAADHNGFRLKQQVIDYLQSLQVACQDAGDSELNQDDDFPVFAARAIQALDISSHDSRAILLCGSGQGMMMAANRFKGIRAGLGWSVEAAEGIRHDEDANVLVLPAVALEHDPKKWQAIIDAFIQTPFANIARYKRRNRELDEL